MLARRTATLVAITLSAMWGSPDRVSAQPPETEALDEETARPEQDDSNSETPLAESPPSPIPLAVGNVWKYRLVATTKLGRVLETRLFESKIVGLWLDEDEPWHCMRHDRYCFWLHPGRNGLEHCLIRPDPQTNGLKKPDPILFFKYDAKVGDSWSLNPDDDTERTMQCEATSDLIRVPAGEFTCRVYAASGVNNQTTIRYWIAEGVGIVRMEVLPSVFGEDRREVIDLMSRTLRTKDGLPATAADTQK